MSAKNVDDVINRTLSNVVAIFTLSYCKDCERLKELLRSENIAFYNIDIDEHALYKTLIIELKRYTRQKEAPFVFVRKVFVGNYNTIIQKYHEAKLLDLIKGKPSTRYDYEVIVIGGGCGGLEAAKEAATLGKKVALFDYATPNHNGLSWTGLGGTYTNTGSVPTKLTKQASLIGDCCQDGKYFGWNFDFNKKENHNWSKMLNVIHKYINKCSLAFRQHCNSAAVKVFNANVTKFVDKHTIEALDKDQNRARFTSQVFIVATGARPVVTQFPGVRCITSDDLFYLPEKPGKTLVIGSGVLALEVAGFLNSFGIECSILTHSKMLRNYDTKIADMITSHMESLGIKFIYAGNDYEIVRSKHNKNTSDKDDNTNLLMYKLKFNNQGSFLQMYKPSDLSFDTIFVAMGTHSTVADMQLQLINVKLNEINGKIIVNKFDRSHCPTIFAIGDVSDGHKELAPIAVKSGRLLARRMCGAVELMDYTLVPMALYTPLEYSFSGYSEERAKAVYGEDNIAIYQNWFNPLEWEMQRRNHNRSYMKMICLKNDPQTVVGIHIVGLRAAEVIQGFAFAMKLKANKSDFDLFVGIYRTCGDEISSLQPTPEIDMKTLHPTGNTSTV